jgi:hypothetical protein
MIAEKITIDGIEYPFLFGTLAFVELESFTSKGNMTEMVESIRLGLKWGAFDCDQPEPDWNKIKKVLNKDPGLLFKLSGVVESHVKLVGEQIQKAAKR